MATWGLHIRLAEEILTKRHDLDKTGFLIGNIGPDCGLANADWSAFDPPTSISHWKNEKTKMISPEDFRQRHLIKTDIDFQEQSFLLGYYVHLLTDIAFSAFIEKKKEKR